MIDTPIVVKGHVFKIVNQSWEDRAAEVDHNDYVIYYLENGIVWKRFSPVGTNYQSYSEAERHIPGLYEDVKCPTCGHWETRRTI